AVIGDVAVAGLRPADGRARLEAVARTARSGAGTVLRHVTGPRRGPALGAARREPVRRARTTRPRAGLVDVAIAGGRAADGTAVARRMLAAVAGAVALIEAARVPVARARRPRRLLGVRGTRGARARARVGQVAFARRRPARGAGIAGRVRAGVAAAVTLVEAARVAI